VTKTKRRPVREKEVQGRINAFRGARLFITPGNRKSISDIAEEVGSNRHSVGIALLILEFGTAEEINGVESGTRRLDATYDEVRERTTDEERKAKRRAPTQTAELVQSRSIDAEVWGKLRDALDNITGMPSAKDTAVIVRKNVMRIEHVNRKLLVALSWIQEFSDEVTL
jgi:hypothetical protein